MDVPYQGYSERDNHAARLVRYDPEELRRKVVQGGADEFADGLIKALKPRIHCDLCRQDSGYNRWAFNLFAKVAKLANADAMVVVAMLGQLGVRDETELHALVESGRQLQKLSEQATGNLETARDDAVELLLATFREHPEWRAGVLRRLGSWAEIESDGTNGNGTHP